MSAPAVGVVIPALDEGARLPGLLARLAGLPLADVVVVDGGSTDDTVAAAEAAGARVIAGPTGRGPQLHAGAREVRGDVLWFLHADALPPADAVDGITRALADPGVVGGAFLLRTVADADGLPLGPLLRIADLRSRLTRLPYGDQGVFVRREAYEAVGGFPRQPLFEDLELSRALVRRGRLVTVPAEIVVSGRRFQRRPLFYLAVMNTFPALYRLGVPPETLAAWYRHVR